MKRRLTDQEVLMEKRGLDRNLKEVEMLKGQLEYNKDLIKKQNYLDEFEDKWKPFLRKATIEENNQIIKKMEDVIKEKEEMIRNAQEHIANGVEIKDKSKTPAGVG